jgi:hypothetical protein
MNAAACIAAEIIGWLFTILGWVVAILFGVVSCYSLYSLLLTSSPYALIIAVYAIPICLIGAAAAMLGRSVAQFFFPRSTRASADTPRFQDPAEDLLASQEKLP